MTAEVDVVVLTWNDGELLDVALRSALESVGVDVRVVVVDNASEPPAVVPADPRVTLIRNATNRGVAAARNQGAADGAAPFVCFLDSDAELAPTSLVVMVQKLSSGDDVGLVGPVFVGQAPEASGGRAPTLATKLRRSFGSTDVYRPTVGSGEGGAWPVDFTIGACQVFRRVAFDSVGGLDESFFYGPEDVDFCLRLRGAGWRVLQVDGAEVHHPARRRYRRAINRRGLEHGWAVARFLWRHRSVPPLEEPVGPRDA